MDKKERFRLSCIEKLKNARYKPALSVNIAREVEAIIKKRKAKTILFYIPMEFEPNLIALMHRLRKNKVILVPFMQGTSFKTVQYRLPLTKKRFNIKEPGDSNKFIKKIDIAVVPVVGIDNSFRRVGFGKGMYDRFFAKLNYKPYTIFVQNKACISKKNITNFHDIKADIFVTADNLQGFKSVYRDCYGRGGSRS